MKFPEYLKVTAEALGQGTPVQVPILGDPLSLGRDLAESMKAEILRTHRAGVGASPLSSVEAA